jgi:hypothetical protein
MSTDAWLLDVNPWSLPDPRNWLHNTCAVLPAEQVREQLEVFVAQHQEHPKMQAWLDEMLEWGFGYPDALLTLLELGAQAQPYHLGQLFNNPDHFPHTASDDECVKLVEAFLDHGADPNAMTANGGLSDDTPVLAWSMVRPVRPSQCLAIASLLVERGALVEGPDPDRTSGAMRGHELPLQYAIRFPTTALVELLVSKGARADRLSENMWDHASDAAKGWRMAQEHAETLEAQWPGSQPSIGRRRI